MSVRQRSLFIAAAPFEDANMAVLFSGAPNGKSASYSLVEQRC